MPLTFESTSPDFGALCGQRGMGVLNPPCSSHTSPTIQIIFSAQEHEEDICGAISKRLNDPWPSKHVVCILDSKDHTTKLRDTFATDSRVLFVEASGSEASVNLAGLITGTRNHTITLWQCGRKRHVFERLTQGNIPPIQPEDSLEFFVDDDDIASIAKPPEYLNIGLTHRCHYKCFFCSAPQGTSGMPIEQFFTLRTAIESAGVVDLTSPGELFLHPDADKAVRFVADHNRHKGLMFTTTGAALSERTVAAIASRVDQITVSLNASNERTFQRDMGSRVWQRVHDNIRMARKCLGRNRITVSFVAHAENIKELPDFVRLAAQLDVWHVRIAPFFATKAQWARRSLWFCKEQAEALILEAREVGRAVGVEVSNIHESAQHVSSGQGELCAFPTWGAYIIPNGDVLACCYSLPHIMGNVFRDGSFEKVWNAKKYQALRRRLYFSQCKVCPNTRSDWERLESHMSANVLHEAASQLPKVRVRMEPVLTVEHVRAAVLSLKQQTYPVWNAEIVLHSGCDPAVHSAAREEAAKNPKLQVVLAEQETGQENSPRAAGDHASGVCCSWDAAQPMPAKQLEFLIKQIIAPQQPLAKSAVPESKAMTPEPILFSLSHFREIILAAFEIAGVRRFVEVGSQYGMATEQFCEYAKRVNGELITIDPAPQEAGRELIKKLSGQPWFRFIEQPSLEALPLVRDADAHIIDGDHNYYTVLNELEEIARSQGERPWLVFEHDVCWPCGRRDWYYEPARIPAEHRHPYRTGVGVTTDSSELVPGGFGDVPGLSIAVEEGGPRNGVRTAIEDFIAKHPELKFEVIPAIFGVGIIYSRNAPWADKLAELLRPYTHSPLLERMEQNRLWLSIQLLKHHREHQETNDVSTPEYAPGRHPLEMHRVADKAGFLNQWNSRIGKVIEAQSVYAPAETKPFNLTGVCAVCGGASSFVSDFMFSGPDATGRVIPAWRERQICSCKLNCRQRSCFQLLADSLGLSAQSIVYCTEQQTDLFQHIERVFPRVVGSEFYGNSYPLGSVNARGVRNEDITRLTFSDATFDCIFSLDVMEHVPNYKAGFREMARCLKPGGKLLLTAPFHFDEEITRVRATVNADGTLTHHFPPVYHGNPIDPAGSLCFNDFGWDIMEDLCSAGFGDATMFVFTAPHLGYIGLQYVILASRCEANASSRSSFQWPAAAARVLAFAPIPRPTTTPTLQPRANARSHARNLEALSTESLETEAEAFYSAGDWAAAAERYNALTKRLPDKPHAWHGHVRCLRKLGFEVLAGLILDEAAERHPEWRSALESPSDATVLRA